jgi:uncharacterized protein involved in high-affinity Fe2+ transport
MSRSWLGPLITGLIVAGVAGVLLLNLEPSRSSSTPAPKSLAPADPAAPQAEKVRENPIGDEVIKNHLQILAVWQAAVDLDGAGVGPGDLIHLEADVSATKNNPNGFGEGDFIPYLKVAYEIVPAEGGTPLDKGELTPMVAWDGPHYGANILKPKPGRYRLVFTIQPPSAGGMGRHVGKNGGVASWWEPFSASFEWLVEPETKVAVAP